MKTGSTPNDRILAAGLTLLSVVLWGFSPIGTRYMVGTTQAALPAMAFTGLRYGMAALFFAPFLAGARRWTRRDWALGALCGVVGVAGYNLPAALGQRSVSAGLTGLLDAAEPLMIVIFSAVVRRRAPTIWTMIASAIGLCGIVLLAQGTGPKLGDPLGIALVLTGAVLWAGYCVLVTPLVTKRGASTTTAVVVVLGAIPLLAAGAPQTGATLHMMTAWQWLITVALVLGTSVTAMLSWNAGSAGLGAEKAGWFLYLLPVVSVIGGAVLLGEPVKPTEIFGGALIVLSVCLAQRAEAT